MFTTPPKEAHNMATTTTPTQLPRRFIKLAETKTLTTLSTSEIYRRIAAGTFPAQVNLGPKSVAWIEVEVLAWCEARIAASRGETA
jgi:prophage regulatory protein